MDIGGSVEINWHKDTVQLRVEEPYRESSGHLAILNMDEAERLYGFLAERFKTERIQALEMILAGARKWARSVPVEFGSDLVVGAIDAALDNKEG